MRRNEVVSLTVDQWPSSNVIIELTQRPRPITTVPLGLTITKGGAPRTIAVPFLYARQVRHWIDNHRIVLAHRFQRRMKTECGSSLFVSDARGYEGTRISDASLYKCFKCGHSLGRWHPHLGRHTYAAFFLLNGVLKEAEFLGLEAGAMSPSWIHSQGNYIMMLLKRQLGHVSEETTEVYLRWLMTICEVPNFAAQWHIALDSDRN